MSPLSFVKHASLFLPIVACLAGPARAAAPDISGTWTFTFLDNPTLSIGATQCITFTKTGGVSGLANSGTWSSPTYANWGGSYVVNKKNVLTFWGPYGAPIFGYTSEVGTVSAAGINGLSSIDFQADGSPSTTGSFKVTPGCTPAAQVKSSARVSPTGAGLTR